MFDFNVTDQTSTVNEESTQSGTASINNAESNSLSQSTSSSTTSTRRTTEQAHLHRQVNQQNKIKRDAAYRLATVAVSLHTKFDKVLLASAAEAVSRVNQMFGCKGYS